MNEPLKPMGLAVGLTFHQEHELIDAVLDVIGQITHLVCPALGLLVGLLLRLRPTTTSTFTATPPVTHRACTMKRPGGVNIFLLLGLLR